MTSFNRWSNSAKQLLRILLILFAFFTFSLVKAQNFEGRVFHEDIPLEGIIFFNQRSQQAAYSDAMGYFSIAAREGDTVRISSNYYQEKLVIISTQELEQGVVIALKGKGINLEEVVVSKTLEPKKFDMITYTLNLNEDIKEDIKKNPWKYGKPSSYGVDFVAIYKFITSIFKGKRKKPETSNFEPVSIRQMDSLFAISEKFNDVFLQETLNIHPDEKQLYFYYLESKQPSAEIFSKNKELDLLETLLVAAEEFNSLKSTSIVEE